MALRGVADLEAPNATPRSAIRRVHYSQHGWLQEYDCGQQGQCPFEEDAQSDSKLVAYAGLFSHANYPKASDLWVRPAALCPPPRASCMHLIRR